MCPTLAGDVVKAPIEHVRVRLIVIGSKHSCDTSLLDVVSQVTDNVLRILVSTATMRTAISAHVSSARTDAHTGVEVSHLVYSLVGRMGHDE